MITATARNRWAILMIATTSDRSANLDNKRYICRVIYSSGRHEIEIKTNAEIQAHRNQHGWNGNCQKMSLSDVINMTRLNHLRGSYTAFDKRALANSLEAMAVRAEAKYSGCMGCLRKILSIFLNFFIIDSVYDFTAHRDNSLPMGIRSDADFAREVANVLRIETQ